MAKCLLFSVEFHADAFPRDFRPALDVFPMDLRPARSPCRPPPRPLARPSCPPSRQPMYTLARPAHPSDGLEVHHFRGRGRGGPPSFHPSFRPSAAKFANCLSGPETYRFHGPLRQFARIKQWATFIAGYRVCSNPFAYDSYGIVVG